MEGRQSIAVIRKEEPWRLPGSQEHGLSQPCEGEVAPSGGNFEVAEVWKQMQNLQPESVMCESACVSVPISGSVLCCSVYWLCACAGECRGRNVSMWLRVCVNTEGSQAPLQ